MKFLQRATNQGVLAAALLLCWCMMEILQMLCTRHCIDLGM